MNNMEPLNDMMCAAPDDVAYASYRAVEGVVTPNGALHGTILEYTCNIGYRDTILPCLPSRRTCHAGTQTIYNKDVSLKTSEHGLQSFLFARLANSLPYKVE